MHNPEALTRAIIEAVREYALGPNWDEYASSFPLSASGGKVNPDDWWPKIPPKIRARHGNPEISVELDREVIATVICSPKGKNPIVVVSPGVEVLVLDE